MKGKGKNRKRKKKKKIYLHRLYTNPRYKPLKGKREERGKNTTEFRKGDIVNKYIGGEKVNEK